MTCTASRIVILKVLLYSVFVYQIHPNLKLGNDIIILSIFKGYLNNSFIGTEAVN